MKKKQDFTISFEFFPPKTRENLQNLPKTAAILREFAPAFFSVTYGACGSTHDGTIETVKMLQEKTGIPIAPHLSCIGSLRKNIQAILQLYQSIGIIRLVAIRGDLPPNTTHAGELNFARDLVELIRETTQDHFHIVVAAYPECHPEAGSVQRDLIHLKKKIDAGADSAITQYFFNPDAYFRFIDECAKQEIFITVVPGIMPITNFAKLVRFSDTCGAEIPRWIRKRLESYENDEASLHAFGTEVVHNLCQRLINGGAPGLHFYTLNQADATSKLLQLLGVEIQRARTSGIHVL